MEQTDIKEMIEKLKAQRLELVQQANQQVAYINGQIDLLKDMLDKEDEGDDDDK